MCIAVISFQEVAESPLFIASNRDEFHHRPTKEAHFWGNGSEILAGKDLQNGGIWFGLAKRDKKVRVAFVTNYRDPQAIKPHMKSRGHLGVEFLSSDVSAEEFGREILLESSSYNPFNFVCFDGADLFWISSVKKEMQKLAGGTYVLCNRHLDTPWPKVERLRSEFGKLSNLETAGILKAMQDTTNFSVEDLPKTGLSPEWEKIVGPIFIVHEKYGTRSTSLLSIKPDFSASFKEVYYNQQGIEYSRKQFDL